MSATVNCPQCNTSLEMPDELPAGKRLQCPDCGAAFAPPRAADRAAAMKAAPGRADSRPGAGPRHRSRYEDDGDDRDREPSRGRGGSAALLIGVGVVALVLLCGGGLAAIGFMRAVEADSVPQPMPPPVAVKQPMVVQGPMGAGGPGMAPMAPGGGMAGGGMMGGPMQPMPRLGDLAPDIAGVDLDGKPMKLSDLKGKVVYLDFWGEWCPHCRTMYAYQNHLINRMNGKDFVLVGVNSDVTKEEAQAAVKNNKLAWRSWHDGGGQWQQGPIAQRYGVTGYPTSFLIDKNGIVRKQHVGVTADLVLDREVDEVMAAGEQRPPNAQPRWQPGSNAFAQLGEEVAVGPYRVRPPKDYILEKLPAEAGGETYRWKGPAPPDRAAPVFEVSLSPAPPARDLEALLEKEVQAIPAPRRLGFSCGLAERGEVNGLIFVRARWSIHERPQKWAGSGVIYLAFDRDRLVRMSYREIMPSPGGPLDSAPLTLHREAK
jgi:thiol-disulfide isomerase/thioredoxin